MDRQRIPNCSVASALTNYLDIEDTPKQSDIENLLAVCLCNDEEKKLLLRLSMVRMIMTTIKDDSVDMVLSYVGLRPLNIPTVCRPHPPILRIYQFNFLMICFSIFVEGT